MGSAGCGDAGENAGFGLRHSFQALKQMLP
jgi:hypothetical protein